MHPRELLKMNVKRVLSAKKWKESEALIPIQRASELVFHRVLGKQKAQHFFNNWENTDIHTFLQSYKLHSRVKHKISPSHMERIPSEKGLLVLANHPTGIADGLLIMDALLQRRNDVKLIIDIDTYGYKSLESYTIGVHNERSDEHIAKNAVALKKALKWLDDGHCLVLFSHSEVMLNKKLYKSDKDSFWHPTARKIIQKYRGTIIPWAIRGKNSPLFYRLSRIHPQLKHNLIPRESLKRRFRPIESYIGKPFKSSDEHTLLDLELKIRLMSKRDITFSLPMPLKPLKKSKLRPIAPPINSEILREEIERLGPALVTKAQNEVYLSAPNQSPNLLLEIGRLREITFRMVNEGSGKERDIDSHDALFYHLILWDSEAHRIAGAYRLGMGPELFQKSNYPHILYEFYHKNTETDRILKEAMTMGRAFVIPEYQQKPFPLFLLWNGIVEVLKSRSDIRYLVGQTSLPNSYQNFSKLLITEFLWHHFSNKSLRSHFIAYHPLRLRGNNLIKQWVLQSKPEDIKRMDKIIECIEPNGAKTPMLFKRYIEQNARCIGINVDPDFQYSIDILMLTNVEDILING